VKRLPGQTSRARDQRDAAPTQGTCLRTSPQPPLALVEVAGDCVRAVSDGGFGLDAQTLSGVRILTKERPVNSREGTSLAKAVLYDLHVIGEACGMLPPELKARHPDVTWRGWADFRNLTTHQYWRADATIAAEAMEGAIPVLVGMVADELPAAAQAASVDLSGPELRWTLAAVGDRPTADEEAANWWHKQHQRPSEKEA
jgi:uncharacterized protein with HEPN domain